MTSKILDELRQIREENGGLLSPEVVIDKAANEDNPLHSSFEWDDNKAAHQHRLDQARRLVRVYVEVLAPDTEPVNVFVSLKDDRHAEGGYRELGDVLRNKTLREILLSQALEELERWRIKYQQLNELADIFVAIDKPKKTA